MVQANMVNGICASCNNLATCFHFARRGPVFTCEQFDDHVPSRSNPTPQQQQLRNERAAFAAKSREETQRLKGLCVNCEHRFTCAYFKPPGGIWHCEEYA
ncbi:MAG: hypothetical protein ACYSWT_09360 [Planctomycetota bacterium]|jgi:radical SAM protein with 4Fe4S-binding SPASM domain